MDDDDWVDNDSCEGVMMMMIVGTLIATVMVQLNNIAMILPRMTTEDCIEAAKLELSAVM